MKYRHFLSATAVFALVLPSASAIDLYWDNSTADGLWGTPDNWSTTVDGLNDTSAVPGSLDIARFSSTPVPTTTAQSISLVTGRQVLGLNFTAATNVNLVSGTTAAQTLTLGSSGITATATAASNSTTNTPSRVYTVGSSTAAQNINISMLGSQTWTSNITGTVISSDGLFVRGAVSLGTAGNGTLTLAGTSGSTPLNRIFGAISDGGSDRVLSINLDGGTNANLRWSLSETTPTRVRRPSPKERSRFIATTRSARLPREPRFFPAPDFSSGKP